MAFRKATDTRVSWTLTTARRPSDSRRPWTLPTLASANSCTATPAPSSRRQYASSAAAIPSAEGSVNTARTTWAGWSGKPVLQRPLDARVERVEPVQRQRLGRAEPTARRGVGPVVAEDAVRQRQPAVHVQARGML